jgi:hypothetical protein
MIPRALFALLLVLATTGCRPKTLPPDAPLSVALWYWHTPYRVPADEARLLRAAGVTELFVRAVTVRVGDGPAGVRETLPQVWKDDAARLPVHLTVTLANDVVRAFPKIDNGALAERLATIIAHERRRAEAAGVRVAGVQLDFEPATSRLPQYADLLRRLRPRIAGSLSITLLPTWLTSRELGPVLDTVDFSVPQFYEASIGKTRGTLVTVGSAARTRRGVAAAGKLGRTFRAGLPAYGHALAFGIDGRLRGAFRDFGIEEALMHPSLRLDRAETVEGEAIRDIVGGGLRVVFDTPTTESVARQIAAVRGARPANCRGVVLFRYPESDEGATLPLCALKTALTGAGGPPHLTVTLTPRRQEFEAVETGETGHYVDATVTNDGQGDACLGTDSVRVTLRLDRPGVELAAVAPRVRAERVAGTQPASAARADRVRFTLTALSAGQERRLGSLRLPAGARRIDGEWSVQTGPTPESVVRGPIPPLDTMH